MTRPSKDKQERRAFSFLIQQDTRGCVGAAGEQGQMLHKAGHKPGQKHVRDRLGGSSKREDLGAS